MSNFDLDVNDWYSEYENIEIFKLNMSKSLGEMWEKYSTDAVSQSEDGQFCFFDIIYVFYL